jgi:hypothetical protein
VATYWQVSERVKATYGRVPKTCYVADVKAHFGLTRGIAPNRFDANAREHPCPPEFRPHIEKARRYFGMI